MAVGSKRKLRMKKDIKKTLKAAFSNMINR